MPHPIQGTPLRDSGYRAYVAGKWHVGKQPRSLPPARGFYKDSWAALRQALLVSGLAGGSITNPPLQRKSPFGMASHARLYPGSGAMKERQDP